MMSHEQAVWIAYSFRFENELAFKFVKKILSWKQKVVWSENKWYWEMSEDFKKVLKDYKRVLYKINLKMR